MESSVFVFLLPMAFLGGVIDAIGGGGGLLTLPALLAAGLPPHLALGTNKGQAVFGSSSALLRYARAGLVNAPRARVAFPAALVGSALGVELALFVTPQTLKPIVLVLLPVAALAMLLAPRMHAARRLSPSSHQLGTAAAIALVIGAYDGFFGPGTGTFLIVAFVIFFGSELTHASADAKVVNFASNLAAAALFASRGAVVWHIALPMAVAQLLGALVGSQLVLRGGERIVRVAVLLVVVALVVKLALDLR